METKKYLTPKYFKSIAFCIKKPFIYLKQTKRAIKLSGGAATAPRFSLFYLIDVTAYNGTKALSKALGRKETITPFSYSTGQSGLFAMSAKGIVSLALLPAEVVGITLDKLVVSKVAQKLKHRKKYTVSSAQQESSSQVKSFDLSRILKVMKQQYPKKDILPPALYNKNFYDTNTMKAEQRPLPIASPHQKIRLNLWPEIFKIIMQQQIKRGKKCALFPVQCNAGAHKTIKMTALHSEEEQQEEHRSLSSPAA